MSVGSVVRNWGSTPEERAAGYPCDALLSDDDKVLFRAVDVAAPAPLVFRWLCQLRAAPYSYDLLDNLGRRSPRHLTPGLEQLEPGQRFMTIFRLLSFEPGRSITIETTTRAFGRVLVTYAVTPVDDGHCRLVAKLGLTRRRGLLARLIDAVLPAGDLVMMRKQLLTLGRLAERDAASG